ncbi:triple tyrosine motif-containing protein [Pedobacter sp. GR22-6]|uniref:triple tyrosine motif-containing protein n=1 Tax=Pedobacter sp. GR22-6 TaxID=3127957 RepID=UPI00307D7441
MKNIRLAYRFFLCLTLIGLKLDAQELKGIGVPYIQNYSKSDYKAGNQNWSVAKDKNGVLYYGNTRGLLSYDGQYWHQYLMPNRQIIRSVAASADGKIYVGAFGEFGYWSGSDARLSYTSLSTLIRKPNALNEEIWKIYVSGKRVYFQSFSAIYCYENGKIEVIKGPGTLLFLHQVGQKLYAEVIGRGLFELREQQLIALPHESASVPADILSVLPYKNAGLLIGTSKNGLYIYDGKDYQPLNVQATDFLKTYQLNNGVRVLNNYYAFGTILNGIIITNDQGEILQHFSKSSGLQNNTILSLYADDDQNLWTGLDNGIDRIELNSSLYFYFDKSGAFGTVYSSLIYGNKIYLGTNQGLFYSELSLGSNGFDFKLIPGSQGQVWELTEIDGQVFCGHNNGTFKVMNGSIQKISDISGGWTIKKLNSNPDYLVQGTYTGLSLYKKNASGQWGFSHRVAGFTEPSRYVEQDSKGNIWVSHAYRGLYKLELSADLKKVVRRESYGAQNGLPGDYTVNVFNLEKRLLYATTKGFFVHDEISNSFSVYTELNKRLGSFAFSSKIIPAGTSKYWLIGNGRMSLADFRQSGKISIDSSRFSILDGRMVQYYENISRISDNRYLISVDDGFVIYNAAASSAKHRVTLPAVLIREINEIKDGRNSKHISYALPYYRQARIQYQYFLEGYSKDWSDWTVASEKDFTNLSSGDYVFKLRARINEEIATGITEMKFSIPAPFYATIWAFAFYAIIFGLLIYGSKKLYDRKLQIDKQRITERLQAEKEAHLRKEAEANERQIIALQTEKLQVELEGKNRELANSAMSLVYKNELLQKLSEEILKLKDGNGKPLAEDQTRKIQKVIEEGMNDERDWNLFEHSFNEAHENFFKKLKANYPDLVPNDLKLCAYLHMNMSSKEMASLLNITLRGVEIRRYRLRKKLNVPHDKNLSEFLMEL